MPKQRIRAAIKEIFNEQFGFEIYIAMKEGEQLLKRFVLDEGDPNETDGFKIRIRESIKETVKSKFLADDSKYANGDDLANEQNCFYVVFGIPLARHSLTIAVHCSQRALCVILSIT